MVNFVCLIKVIELGFEFFINIWFFSLNKLSRFEFDGLIGVVWFWFFEGVWEILLCFFIVGVLLVFDEVLCKLELEFFFLYCSFVWEFFFEGSFGWVIFVLVRDFCGFIKCLWFVFNLLLLLVGIFCWVILFEVWLSLVFVGLVFGCIVDDFVWEELEIDLCGFIEGVEGWDLVFILLFWIGLIILFGVLRCDSFDGIWFILKWD